MMHDTASQLQRHLGLHRGPGIFLRMRQEAVSEPYSTKLRSTNPRPNGLRDPYLGVKPPSTCMLFV
jgi:hypothetical protein